MAKSKWAQAAHKLCAPIIEEMGYDLIDVEYVREGSAWFLRFYIDKKGGVNLEDCTAVSQAIDPFIEDNLELTQAYFLEVSSPGLDRPLKTYKDWLRHEGEEVEVTLYQMKEGQKKWQGKLVRAEENRLSLEGGDGQLQSFAKEELACVKQVIHFE